MIRVSGLTFSYGEKDVLKDLSFETNAGDVIALLGVNGSGKSTLLKTLNRILRPKSGSIFIEGRDIRTIPVNEIGKHIGYMSQRTNGAACTVFEAVLLGRKPHINWNVSHKDLEITHRMLKTMNIEDLAFRQCNQLSGGEMQKVVISRALAQEPKILLLDEPISHLDIKNQIDVMGLLREVTKRLSLTTVVVLHDLNTALRFADSFIMLKNGRVYCFGGREVVTSESIREVYHIDARIYSIEGLPVVMPVCNT